MTTVRITIQDDTKAQALLNMLKVIDFVEIESEAAGEQLSGSEPATFWEVAGEQVLKEEWDLPENDHWDEFYRDGGQS